MPKRRVTCQPKWVIGAIAFENDGAAFFSSAPL
jgi:hypothetical protein